MTMNLCPWLNPAEGARIPRLDNPFESLSVHRLVCVVAHHAASCDDVAKSHLSGPCQSASTAASVSSSACFASPKNMSVLSS